jgi:methanesulfonate monooxygenase small subunit
MAAKKPRTKSAAAVKPASKKARTSGFETLAEREKAVRELIARTCLVMDDYDFNAYLDLCHADFRYIITTYSPELRKDITWLDHDKPGMKTLLDVLPLHASDHFLRLTMSRHLSVYTIDYSDNDTRAATVSGLGVAKLKDTVVLESGKALLLSREVRLDTRMLGETGSLIPF